MNGEKGLSPDYRTMEGGGKEAASLAKNRARNAETIALDLSALATGVHVHQSEGRPFA
jgi:hypothetical protein